MEENQIELSGNKYFTWYWNICNRAKDRILPEGIYIERHHKYPRGLYGQNKELVALTAKEHYIVHLLLWWGLRQKFGIEDKRTDNMRNGFQAMNMKTNKTFGRYNSNLYEFSRIAYNETNSKRNKGKKLSEETKRKISASNKGRICSEETRAKISESNKGKNHSEETKKNMSNDKKGRPSPNKGKIISEETRKKMSKSLKGKPGPNIGKKFSEESKKKMSESHKGQIAWNKGKTKETDKRIRGANSGSFKTGESSWNKGIPMKEETKQKFKKAILQFDKDLNLIAEYNSIKEAATMINGSSGMISLCCNNKVNFYKNCKWEFKIKDLN